MNELDKGKQTTKYSNEIDIPSGFHAKTDHSRTKSACDIQSVHISCCLYYIFVKCLQSFDMDGFVLRINKHWDFKDLVLVKLLPQAHS